MFLSLKMPDKDSKFGQLANDVVTGTAIVKYWPIMVAVAMALISVGAIYQKLDYIAKALDRNEAQFTALSDRQTLYGQSNIEIRSQLNNQAEAIGRLNAGLSETNRRVEQLADKQRWVPK